MTWEIRGKTVLVTGGTSGIGRAAAVRLARLGARVVIVGRDPARAAAEVADHADSREVSHLRCDFSSQAATHRLTEQVVEQHDRLDVLVNNAGGMHRTRQLTGDGIELTFAVNHLGYFLLTNLLLDLLIHSAPARVVSVTSRAHRTGALDFDDLGYQHGYDTFLAYKRSKLANVLFARELARRLADTGVTSNSLHPGTVDTNIWSGADPEAARRVIARHPLINVEQGAERITHLVTDPALQGITGGYFEAGKLVDPSPRAMDDALAQRLWQVSAELVGLPNER